MGEVGSEKGEEETAFLLENGHPPEDGFHLAYVVYFILGAGFLVPWNAFITAVDYFSYIYPDVSIDRIFAVCYMFCALIFLVIMVGWWAHRSGASVRVNSGLVIFVISLLIVPVLDLAYVKGQRGLYSAYDVTVFAVVLAGIGDALVQGGVIGSAGELPERYMQAVVAGTAASGVLVSIMRILTKAVFPQDAPGLRKSAHLYFAVSILTMVLCLFCYNLAHHLPVVRYYKAVRARAEANEREGKDLSLTGSVWRSTLWNIVTRVKWFGFGIFLIYAVTLSIFPGYLTQDVHSEALKDWYSIILIATYNVFDLVGKCLPAVYMVQSEAGAIMGAVARLLFFPLFLACMHGPEMLRTEIPVTVLTSLLGLTNGYLTSVLMILAPKSVPIQHSETAGIAIVLFLVLGLACGSVISWFWVI
ncbi:equilibrative nucleotide transporter 1 [Wolffia australiana]